MKAFSLFLFLIPPWASGPAGSAACFCLLSSAWGTRRSVHVGLMPRTEGWTGESTTQSTLVVEEKGHCHLSLKRSWNREPHTGTISVQSRGTLTRLGFSPKPNGMKHGAVRSTTTVCVGLHWALYHYDWTPHLVPSITMQHDRYVLNHTWQLIARVNNWSKLLMVLKANSLFCFAWQQCCPVLFIFSHHAVFDCYMNCCDMYWQIINAKSLQWNNTELP